MMINISNCKLEHRIFLYILDEENLKKYDLNTENIMYFQKNSLMIYPDKIKIVLSEYEIKQFEELGENSILEVEGGQAFVFYNSNELDNALFITNQCNSNCIMCPISKKVRKNASIETLDTLLDVCRYIPNDWHHITITGGEPFLLKKDIFKLFEYLKCNLYNVEYLLLTNGRALSNKDYFDNFAETAPPRLLIGIPLHGHEAELHDYITKTPGSFAQTVSAIKKLISAGFKVEIRIVVSKLNIDYVHEIVKYIVNNLYGVATVKFIGLEMLGNARQNMETVWIDYKYTAKMIEDPIKNLVNKGIDVALYNFPLCCVSKEFWYICEKSISPYKIRFLDECTDCKKKDACGGMFQGTYKLMEGIVKAIK